MDEYSSNGLVYILNALDKFVGLRDKKQRSVRDLR